MCRYAHSERPVVVRNVTLGWPVMEVRREQGSVQQCSQELDYYWLKRQYLRLLRASFVNIWWLLCFYSCW